MKGAAIQRAAPGFAKRKSREACGLVSWRRGANDRAPMPSGSSASIPIDKPAPSAPEQRGAASRYRTGGRIVYAILLIAVFAAGAWLRFEIPQTPIADNDTWGYLNPAVSALNGGPFVHTFTRNFLYPAFVYLILKVTGDFRAISVVQHVLGLGAGALLLASWHAVWKLARGVTLPVLIERALGLAMVTIFLLSGYEILFENHIRPEGVTAFFSMLSIWFATKFLHYRWRDFQRCRALGCGMALLFVLAVLTSLKPSFLATACWASLPVWWTLLVRGFSWREKVMLAGVPYSLAAVLLWLPEARLERDDPEARTVTATTLFAIHANFIREQLKEDFARGEMGPGDPRVTRALYEALCREMDKTIAGEHYRTLGFDPDYLMFENSFCLEVRQRFSWNAQREEEFYRYWYLRTLGQKPWAFVAKIGRQMEVFYGKRCPAFYARSSYPLAEDYASGARGLALPLFHDALARFPAGQRFLAELDQLAKNAPDFSPPHFISTMHDVLARKYLRLMWLALVLSLAVLCVPILRARGGLCAAALLLVAGYSFSNCLEVAIVHSLEIRRYTAVQFSFALLSEFMTLAFAVWVVVAALQVWRGRMA